MKTHAAFRRLMWSNLAAQAAEQISLAAAPLIAVLALGAGTGQTGLLAAAQALPFLLLSLPAGMLADRTSQRRLMAGAELVRAAALLALPVLLWQGWLGLGSLALIGALAATGTVAYSVAAPAMLPLLVQRAALTAANTRLELVRSLAFAAWPARWSRPQAAAPSRWPPCCRSPPPSCCPACPTRRRRRAAADGATICARGCGSSAARRC